MPSIEGYLADPLSVGVYYSEVRVDFSKLPEALSQISSGVLKVKGESPKSSGRASLLASQVTSLDVERVGFLDDLLKVLSQLAALGALSTDLEGLFLEEVVFKTPRGESKAKVPLLHPLPIFHSRLFLEDEDILHVDSEPLSKGVWRFHLISLSEGARDKCIARLKLLPMLDDKVDIVLGKKYNSARFALRPYHLAVQFWLGKELGVSVPKDLKSYFGGALRYFHTEEWRTSTILSAIIVESLLADMYEEQFKKFAPNRPLGYLFSQIKKGFTFPAEIAKAIEMANKARILAVHRSQSTVSELDATEALFGASKFTLWYLTK